MNRGFIYGYIVKKAESQMALGIPSCDVLAEKIIKGK